MEKMTFIDNHFLKTFSASGVSIQVEAEKYAGAETEPGQYWNLIIKASEQTLRVVVPGENLGEMEIYSSSDQTPPDHKNVTNHQLFEPTGLEQAQPPIFEHRNPYFDEWIQGVFVNRFAKHEPDGV